MSQVTLRCYYYLVEIVDVYRPAVFLLQASFHCCLQYLPIFGWGVEGGTNMEKEESNIKGAYSKQWELYVGVRQPLQEVGCG
jgi:hypothetical protein